MSIHPEPGLVRLPPPPLACMLSLCKLVSHWDMETKSDSRKSRIGGCQANDLNGKTLWIIGLGRIG